MFRKKKNEVNQPAVESTTPAEIDYTNPENYRSPELDLFEKNIKEQISKSSQFQWARLWYTITMISYAATIIVWVVFFFTYNPQQKSEIHQVTKQDGKVYVGKIITLPTPRFTDAALRDFIKRAMNNIYNLSYFSFEENVQQASQYFCEEGFIGYKNYLTAWDLKSQLGNNNQIQRGAVSGQIITVGGSKGFKDNDGNHYWKVLVPMNLARFGTTTAIRSTRFEVTIKMEYSDKGKSGFCINEIRED